VHPGQLLRAHRHVAGQDGEVGDKEPIAEQDAGDDGRRHGDLAHRRKIGPQGVGGIVAHQEDVDPVQDHAEDDQRGGEEQPTHGPAHRRVEEQRQRGEDAQHDLDDERDRGRGLGEQVQRVPADGEVDELHQPVGAEEPGDEAGQGCQQFHLRVTSEADVGVDRLEDHHGEPHRDGRQEEQDGQDVGVPQRAQLGGRDEHERAE